MAYRYPSSNPFRSLPARQYQGPLPTPLPGLAGFRRGLGQLTTVDANGNIVDENGNILGNVNTTPMPGTFGPGACPGSPGCPGYIAPSAIAGPAPVSGPTAGILPVTSSSFTAWLNQNSSTVLWIGGIALAVLLLSKVTR